MRTVFEVAPARECSRRLCVPPSPKKSLFSSNCCFPKSCPLTVLHWVWQKQQRERRKYGIVGIGWGEKREKEGRRKKKRVRLDRTDWTSIPSPSRELLPAPESPSALALSPVWKTLQSPPTLAVVPLCIHLTNPQCFKTPASQTLSYTVPSVLLC